MSKEDLQLLRGTLDMLVLKALEAEPRHGYGIAQWIHEVTGERLQIEDGALYNALHRMEERRWLISRWGVSDNNRRAKYYRLTRRGRRQLERASERWSEYADAVFAVMGSGDG